MTTNLLGLSAACDYLIVEPNRSGIGVATSPAGSAKPGDDALQNEAGIKAAQRGHTVVDEQTFQEIVDANYESLYRFALSLTHRQADACDLTQEAFRRLVARADQIRDHSKIKTWLFTTVYRRYVTCWRRETRFPHFELGLVGPELPVSPPPNGNGLDAATVRDALNNLDDLHRLPLLLFYLEDHTYAEIAEILNVPCGTVMSRIARGREQLRKQLREPKRTLAPTPLELGS